MKKLLVFLVSVVVVVYLGCDANAPQLPTGPDTLPSTTTVEPAPPPHVRGPMFSYDNVRGVLMFAGTQATESQLVSVFNQFRSAWPDKQLAVNVCSETAEWEHTPWDDGEPAFSKENRENLRRFLDVAAREGVMVRLNIFCTVRDNHQWMEENMAAYATFVAEVASEYENVLLSVANEPYHPNSWLRFDNRVREVRDVVRNTVFSGPIGADDTVSPRKNDFRYAYADLGFTTDFHPFRNPDPGPSDFDRMVEENSLPVVISEPTAYSAWRESGCCTSNKQQILSYFRRAERRGIIMFYHSTWGLEFPMNPSPEWIPIP